MGPTDNDKTAVYKVRDLTRDRCTECEGAGQLRIDSQNITEDFEVEKQTVITECPACAGTGFKTAG